MRAIAEYRCRLCGTLFTVGGLVHLEKHDDTFTNTLINVSKSEIIVKSTDKNTKCAENVFPLIRYHSCNKRVGTDIGLADFAGFTEVTP